MKDKLLRLLDNSYSVYSHFPVAAIVVAKDGREFYGVNVEDASYRAGACAERVAIFNAITAGCKKGDLKELNLIKAIEVGDKSGRMLICPELTDRGKAYIASNPSLKNPTIWDDKKYIINTIISVAALIVAIIALFK